MPDVKFVWKLFFFFVLGVLKNRKYLRNCFCCIFWYQILRLQIIFLLIFSKLMSFFQKKQALFTCSLSINLVIMKRHKTKFQYSSRPNSSSRVDQSPVLEQTKVQYSSRPNSSSQVDQIPVLEQTKFQYSSRPNSRTQVDQNPELKQTKFHNLNRLNSSYEIYKIICLKGHA